MAVGVGVGVTVGVGEGVGVIIGVGVTVGVGEGVGVIIGVGVGVGVGEGVGVGARVGVGEGVGVGVTVGVGVGVAAGSGVGVGAAVTVKPVLAVVRPTWISIVWIPVSRPGMMMSKTVMPLLSVEGLGAVVTSMTPTVTLFTGWKALKPSAEIVTAEPGTPLVWLRRMPGGSTAWRVVFSTDTPSSSWKVAVTVLVEGIEAVVGIRIVNSNPPLAEVWVDMWLTAPPPASYTTSTEKLEPLSFRAGKFSPRTDAWVPTLPVSGVMVTVRAGTVPPRNR